MTNAITQMDQVTQGNAASAEETASAAEQLNAQSALLHNIVQALSGLAGSTVVAHALRRLPDETLNRPIATQPTKVATKSNSRRLRPVVAN